MLIFRPNLNRAAAILNGSPLSMFFQSLLPSFNLQQQAQQQNPAGVAQLVPGGQPGVAQGQDNEGTLCVFM